MTNSNRGGRRKGAGRKPSPNPQPPKKYLRPPVELPTSLLEQRATEWYMSLDPRTRLESIVEDFTFQDKYGDYLEEIGELDFSDIDEEIERGFSRKGVIE